MFLATQNPIEQEGTYPLPEAQLDRLLFHFMRYPSFEDEVRIAMMKTFEKNMQQCMTMEDLAEAQKMVEAIPIGEKL